MLTSVVSAMDMAVIRLRHGMVSLTGGAENILDGNVEESTTSNSGVDVEELLNRTGAESGDGALVGVNELVEEYGAGFFNIGQKTFVYAAAVFFIITCGAFVVAGGNASKQSENKSAAIYRVLATIAGFAAAGFLLFAQSVGESLLN